MPSLLALVQVLFLLIALLLIVNAFVPGWRTSAWAFEFTPRALIYLLIELVVLAIVYVIVVDVLGVLLGHAAAAGAASGVALGLMYPSQRAADGDGDGADPVPPVPAPVTPTPTPVFHPRVIQWRWWASFVAWACGMLAEVIKAAHDFGWANLGLTDVQANQLMFLGILLGVVGGAVQAIPQFPDSVRLVGEKVIAERRAVLRQARR